MSILRSLLTKMVPALALIGVLPAAHLQAQELPPDLYSPVRNQVTFDLQLSRKFCDSHFKHKKWIELPLSAPWVTTSFNLFAFSHQAYDPTKESLLMIPGGPGQISDVNHLAYTAGNLPNFNIITIHLRGAGCSHFNDPGTNQDHFITNEQIVSDMELVRKAYGIKSWKAVLGISYGTIMALLYSHLHPSSVQKLVLDGLGIPEREKQSLYKNFGSKDRDSIKLFELVESLRKDKDSFMGRLSDKNYDAFLDAFHTYLDVVPLMLSYQLLLNWDWHNKNLNLQKINSHPLVKKLHTPKVQAALFLLGYSGEPFDQNAFTGLILKELFPEFISNDQFFSDVQKYIKEMLVQVIPVKAQRPEPLLSQMPMSLRVFSAVHRNAEPTLKAEHLCTTTPMLIFAGDQDMATPIQDTINYISNRNCASSPHNKALIIQGGGHASSDTNGCALIHTYRFINDIPFGQSDLDAVCPREPYNQSNRIFILKNR